MNASGIASTACSRDSDCHKVFKGTAQLPYEATFDQALSLALACTADSGFVSAIFSDRYVL